MEEGIEVSSMANQIQYYLPFLSNVSDKLLKKGCSVFQT